MVCLIFAYLHTHIALQHNLAEFVQLIKNPCAKAVIQQTILVKTVGFVP